MRSSRRLGLALAVLSSASLLAQSGAKFYVSPSGSNSNSGSFTAPWRTIQHAANSAKAGATVYVEAGIYHESVNFPESGTASEPITFVNYPGEAPTLDGTGLRVNNTQGLFNIVNQSYITVQGFEIRNYTTADPNLTPAGIWITGSGSGVRLLNNRVHNITTTAEGSGGNAFGIAVYGTVITPISQLTISGNQVYSLKTGQSESVNVDGNVTHFTVTNNLIHDNDNIGFDAIGGEGVGPTGHDQASFGEVSGNTIYNISSLHNGGYNSYGADGIYCDGCKYVVFERNLVHHCDLNIEVAAENGGFDGSNVTVRNNVFYDAYTVGISIGGYGNCTKGHLGCGGSDHVVIVNNSLYNNNTRNQGAEFQIQYRAGSTNIFENNIVYAGIQDVWIYGPYKGSSPTLDWNLYYSLPGYQQGNSITWNGQSNFVSFAAYQTTTGEDRDSFFANPDYISLTLPNLDVTSSSPAINAGSTSLTCSEGYCGGSKSIYGDTDFAGNPRFNLQGQINLGAYEK